MIRALHFFGTFLAETLLVVLFVVAALLTSPLWGPWVLWQRSRGAVFLAVPLLLAGCGASALDRTERVYGVAHAAQAETVARFEGRIRERVREACPTGEDACALEVAAEHRAAAAGLALSADALDAAGRELVRWGTSGEERSPAACVRIRNAVAAVRSAMALVVALGTDLSALGLPAWECEGESE